MKNDYLANWKACPKSIYEKIQFHFGVKWLDDIICHVCWKNGCHRLNYWQLGFVHAQTISYWYTLFHLGHNLSLESFSFHELCSTYDPLEINYIEISYCANDSLHLLHCFILCLIFIYFINYCDILHFSILLHQCLFFYYLPRCVFIVLWIVGQVRRLTTSILWVCNWFHCFIVLMLMVILQILPLSILLLLM